MITVSLSEKGCSDLILMVSLHIGLTVCSPLDLFGVFAHLIFAEDIASPLAVLVLPSSNSTAVSSQGYVKIVVLRVDDC